MKALVEPLEGNLVKLTVDIDEAEFDKAIDDAFAKIAREVRLPGFRPGKAPRRILEAKLGSGVAREQALQDSLPDFYARAVAENEVDVIAPPDIDITAGQDAGAVSFDAVVEIRPTVTVDGYDGLKVTIPSPHPSDDEVQQHVDHFRGQFGSLEVAERPVLEGDHVTLDLHGSRDGEPLPGAQADDYVYEVGGASEQIDGAVRGAKVGDVVEFDAETDEGEVHYRVLVKEVQENVLPDLDDEFVAENSEFETVGEMRAAFTDRLRRMKVMQATMATHEAVGEALAALVDIEVPEAMIVADMQNRAEDLAMRLQAQGMSLDDYLGASGRSQEEVAAEFRDAATASVKVDLALRAVAEAEQIDVSEDDLDAEVASLAARIEEEAPVVRERLDRGGQTPAVRSDLRKRRALEWLVEHAELVDDEGRSVSQADLDLGDDDPSPPEPDDPADGTPDDEMNPEDPT